jgi:hypothetical protein
VVALAAIGCQPFVPPSAFALLEPADTLGAGRVSVQAGGGVGAFVTTGAMRGGGGGTLRARVGVAPDHDVSLTGSSLLVDAASDGSGDYVDDSVAAGRLGWKWAMVEHWSLLAGFGGGVSPAGGFLSGDVGLVGDVGAPPFQTYGAIRASLSGPLDGRHVPSARHDDRPVAPGLTGHVTFLAGFQVRPLDPLRLTLEGGAVVTAGADEFVAFELYLAAGVELVY